MVGERKENKNKRIEEEAYLCLAYCSSTVQKTKATMLTSSSLESKEKNPCDSNIDLFQDPTQ